MKKPTILSTEFMKFYKTCFYKNKVTLQTLLFNDKAANKSSSSLSHLKAVSNSQLTVNYRTGFNVLFLQF